MRQEQRREDLRVAYQVAVDLHVAEMEAIWARQNAMLVANSLVLGGIALEITSTAFDVWVRNGLALAGIAICILWLSMHYRGWAYHDLRLYSASELESKLSPEIKTLSKERGKALADGGAVIIKVRETTKTIQIPKFLRWPAKKSAQATIWLFLILYVLSFFASGASQTDPSQKEQTAVRGAREHLHWHHNDGDH